MVEFFRKLKSSIVLLILGVFMIKSIVLVGDGCKSQGDGFLFILLTICYLIIFIIIQIISIIKLKKNEGKYNFIPLIITLCLFVLLPLAFNQESFESPTIIKANTNRHHTLYLRKNNTYKIQIRYVEASCFYKGTYIINKDTIILLDENIKNKTDSAFYNKYLINKKLNLLYPIEISRLILDSTKVLTIEREE